jgi:acetyl-CoA carboxylase biotin carboxyl carrier protein
VSDEQKSSGPFDVETVENLVRLMREYELGELILQDGDKRICLRRGAKPVLQAPVSFPHAPNYPQAGLPPAPTPNSMPSAEPAPSRKLLEIKSNMVGVFYAKPAPDKDDFVKVGTRVNPDTVVCKIEALKIFNDLTAGCSGTIAEICVQNGQFVEFDQVLFRVEPS